MSVKEVIQSIAAISRQRHFRFSCPVGYAIVSHKKIMSPMEKMQKSGGRLCFYSNKAATLCVYFYILTHKFGCDLLDGKN